MMDALNCETTLDTLWVLLCSFLVFFMNAGFGCLEAGLCRAKNAVNIFAKNFVVFALASIAYWAVGFALMYGNGNSFVGLTGWFVPAGSDSLFTSLGWAKVPLQVKFFFQLVFAGTAATIVSGCVAERIHYGGFMIFSLFLVACVYPLTGHWIWGGGWLQQLGMIDFAGSAAVHTVGGWAGLAGILVLGSRIGKFSDDGDPVGIPGHSMPLVFIGAMILWLGWFGFNPGSTMAISGSQAEVVAHIVVVTNLGCVAGLLAATAMVQFLTGKPDFTMTVNGALAGLVSITASCAYITPMSACLIGAVGGVLTVYGCRVFDALHIDDPVGALSVHLLGGVWGTLALGLFATPDAPGKVKLPGLLYDGGLESFGIQLLGVSVISVFSFVLSYTGWLLVDRVFGLRVDPKVELEGLDIHEMGMAAYPMEQVEESQRAVRGSTDPFDSVVPLGEVVPSRG